MPMRPITEPPLSDDVDQDEKVFAFCICVAFIIGLAVIGLVLHYHFR